MEDKTIAVLEILKEIKQEFSRQDKINRKNREITAELITKFVDSGGWLILGYSTLKQMYENLDEHLPYTIHWFIRLYSLYNYEVLLGIPKGTYSYAEMEGFRDARYNIVLPPFHSHGKIVSGSRCDLDKAEIVKNKWKQIQNYTKKEIPNENEIYEACKTLFKTITAKGKKSHEYYQGKIEQSTSELATIQSKAKEEIEKYQKEIKELKFKLVQLEEENQRLKKQLISNNKKVEVRF